MTKTALITDWFEELWNRGDESTIDRLAAVDLVAHGLGPEDLVGREQLRTFYRTFRDAFPTVSVAIDRVLESGDFATCLTHVRFSTADGRGPFTIEGSCTVRIAGDRIVEGWNYFDFLSLLTQMGAVSPNAMTEALTQV